MLTTNVSRSSGGGASVQVFSRNAVMQGQEEVVGILQHDREEGAEFNTKRTMAVKKSSSWGCHGAGSRRTLTP